MNLDMTLIGQMITFLLFVGLTVRFVWPKLSAALEERRKKIAEGLSAAAAGKHELEVAQHQVRDMIRHAKEQAAVIVEQANARAHHIEEEARVSAREAALRIKQSAEADIAQQYVKVQSELQNELADLVLMGVKKVLETPLDETQEDVRLRQLITEVGVA